MALTTKLLLFTFLNYFCAQKSRADGIFSVRVYFRVAAL